MPMYEYMCDKCDHKTHAITAISDRDGVTDTKCDKCDGLYKRCVGNGGFRLLGGGWADAGYSNSLGDQPDFIDKYGDQS